ncbi:hypothetical protein SDC9_181326 [bioreactor metagenome]|uniref:Uncharacterized protein n=1 Tax=bioreactor metagenome TaxID=1076179 RepID=A0A645HCL4_9ZZZZ
MNPVTVSVVAGVRFQVVTPESNLRHPPPVNIFAAGYARRRRPEPFDPDRRKVIGLGIIELQHPTFAGIQRESAVVGRFQPVHAGIVDPKRKHQLLVIVQILNIGMEFLIFGDIPIFTGWRQKRDSGIVEERIGDRNVEHRCAILRLFFLDRDFIGCDRKGRHPVRRGKIDRNDPRDVICLKIRQNPVRDTG